MKPLGTALIVIGTLMIVAGILVNVGWLGWFGRLPGDIRIERENVKVYAPIASMLLVSVVLSLVVWIVRRLS